MTLLFRVTSDMDEDDSYAEDKGNNARKMEVVILLYLEIIVFVCLFFGKKVDIADVVRAYVDDNYNDNNYEEEEKEKKEWDDAIYEYSNCENSKTEKSSLAKEDVTVAECREIFPSSKQKDCSSVAVLSYRLSDGCIHYYDSQAIQKIASESLSAASSVSQAMQSHSDLIPNVYEGGLKVWECAIDLLEFLQNAEISFAGKSVLELGCGAGLPGIIAAKRGATHVHFQDYNSEVLEFYTIANVRLNQIEESGKCTCRYFSGDWSSFQQQSHSILGETFRYDIILTAETIYKTENYSKLVAVFESCLAEDGIVYLAAKSNYFGVGGGIRDFEQFVKKQGQFTSEVCHTTEAGVPREIIQLKRQE